MTRVFKINHRLNLCRKPKQCQITFHEHHNKLQSITAVIETLSELMIAENFNFLAIIRISELLREKIFFSECKCLCNRSSSALCEFFATTSELYDMKKAIFAMIVKFLMCKIKSDA